MKSMDGRVPVWAKRTECDPKQWSATVTYYRGKRITDMNRVELIDALEAVARLYAELLHARWPS